MKTFAIPYWLIVHQQYGTNEGIKREESEVHAMRSKKNKVILSAQN
jgi:hypothetical protein